MATEIDTEGRYWILPTIFFYGPELDKEKKKEMISSFTQTASKLTGIAESAFVVYLRPSGPESVGVGGELLEELQKRQK
jgi:4-oxalocrotonate tautomerase